MKGNYLINPENHKGLVCMLAKRVQSLYGYLDFQDIVSEINILIMKYSSPIQEGERRKVCYSPSMGAESTFIVDFIGKKIFQTIKYSGLVCCQSIMSEGKQVFEHYNNVNMSRKVENHKGTEDIDYYDSIETVNGFDSMYDNEGESNINGILSCVELDTKERKTLNCIFVSGMTLEEVGRKLSLTSERVRQIKEKALSKMRKSKAVKEFCS